MVTPNGLVPSNQRPPPSDCHQALLRFGAPSTVPVPPTIAVAVHPVSRVSSIAHLRLPTSTRRYERLARWMQLAVAVLVGFSAGVLAFRGMVLDLSAVGL